MRMAPRRPVKAVILYDEFAAAIDAKEVLENVAAQLQDEFVIEIDFWRLAMLEHPQQQILASRGVAAADLILVAGESQGNIPENARAWLEDCLAHKPSGGKALVALLGTQEAVTNALSALGGYLKDLASRCRADFLTNAGIDGQSATTGIIQGVRAHGPARRRSVSIHLDNPAEALPVVNYVNA